MQTIVKGVHLRVGKQLRSYVEEHLLKPLGVFYDDEAAVLEVRLVDTNGPKGGKDKECRITVRLPGVRTLQITEVAEDIYKAIAFARDRAERLAKREIGRQRQINAHRVSRPASRLAPDFVAAELLKPLPEIP